ncbi:MAG: hypothetical protein QOH47_1537 [Sphingomonadales bacterium]|jgi:hypothetical protein|nr:hypothetical protein [Sphingomonadales bacterium]
MPTDLREKPSAAEEPVIAPAAKVSAARQSEGEAAVNWGLDFLIDQYRTRQNEFVRNAGAPNHDIFEPRLAAGTPGFTAVPHCMFFYYMRIDRDGRLRVAHYRYVDGDPADPKTWQPIEYSRKRLEPLVQSLARNARPSGLKDPRPDAQENFQGIVWKRKSYIAIFLDEANWKFHKSSAQDAAVVFITEPKNGKIGTENHSFFDAMDFEIDMPIAGGPATDKRSAIVFVNHMKGDDQGTDLGDGVEELFQFKMFLDVAFASGTAVPMTVIFDPDGTNMGPPQTPP